MSGTETVGTGADPVPEWLSLDGDEELEWAGEPAYESMLAGIVWGIVFIPLLGLGLLMIAGAVLSVRNTDYVITNESLYVKQGVLSTNIESTDLDRIQNTEFSQSFVGSQLGYGTIEISTAGSGGSDLAFSNVEDPRTVRDRINELSSAASTGRATADADADRASEAEASVEELRDELRATREALETIEELLRERSDLSESAVDGAVGAVDSSDEADGTVGTIDADDEADGTVGAVDPDDGTDGSGFDWED